jgi:hypothetical protein
VTVDDCKLLETMNIATKEKYSQMGQMSQRLMKEMSKLQNTCKSPPPNVFYPSDRANFSLSVILDADFSTFIQHVEDIHKQSIEMENTAKALDEYSRYLGKKKKKKCRGPFKY